MSDASDALDPLTALISQKLPESVAELRALLDGFAGLMNTDPPEIGAFHEGVRVREIAGARVTSDVHVPKGAGPHPVLVYLHGGGWVAGSPATHRKLAQRFADAGQLVFNIDYRLAPEHPFPAPFEDCLYAVQWAAEQAGRYGGDAGRLAVGGDSAGGNLAAAVAAALPEVAGAPRVGAVLLLYGVFDFDNIGVGPPLPPPPGMSAAEMEVAGQKLLALMVESYLGPQPSQALLRDPRVSPLHVASKLPPAYVLAGSLDGLAAQAEALAKELARAGITHEHVVVDGMPHGFAQMEFFPQARQSIDRMAAFLATTLGS